MTNNIAEPLTVPNAACEIRCCSFHQPLDVCTWPHRRNDQGSWRRTVFIYCVLVLGSIVTLLPFSAHSQERNNLSVGLVSLGPLVSPTRTAFLGRMAELGYEQGRNFTFEFTRAPNREAYGQAYRELVARKVDILIAGGPEISIKSALAATSVLPIVMVAVDYDPFASGYVQSLARPGGNVTGLFFQQIALTKKRVQLMKEAFPSVKAAIVFWDWVSSDQWKGAKTAADDLDYPVHGVELRARPYDYDRAIAKVAPEGRRALMVLASPIFRLPARRRLPDFAIRHNMPSMFFARSYAEAGGLMSYGASIEKMFRRAADYIDSIAKGAKPGDLPIEQPTKFELVVNLKTAKALGIKLPQSILLRVDDVIE